MPEHKENEVSQNVQEQNGGKQQTGAGSNTQSGNKHVPPPQHDQSAVGEKKNEDQRTGDGTGARAGEYS